MRGIISGTYVQVVLRVILGGILLVAGSLKLPYIETLAWEIEQYQILPAILVMPYAWALPFIEIILGITLLLGVCTRYVAILSGLLTASFMFAKVSAEIRGLGIDVCPCFGPLVPLLFGPSLAIGSLMLVCAVLLIAADKYPLSITGLCRRGLSG